MARTDPDSDLAMDEYPRFPPAMIGRNLGFVLMDEKFDPNEPRTITEEQYRHVMRLCKAETLELHGPDYVMLSDRCLSHLERVSHAHWFATSPYWSRKNGAAAILLAGARAKK